MAASDFRPIEALARISMTRLLLSTGSLGVSCRRASRLSMLAPGDRTFVLLYAARHGSRTLSDVAPNVALRGRIGLFDREVARRLEPPLVASDMLPISLAVRLGLF